MTHTIEGYTFDYGVETRYSPILCRPLQQLTLALPGGGCAYWIKTRGRGCRFCGFPGLTRLLNLGEGHEQDFGGWRLEARLLKAMYDEAMAASAAAEKLAIFNGGSFFVDSELPPEFRKSILDDASRRAGLRQVMVESRPEYITAASLDEAEPVLAAGQDFIIGVGVESHSDHVRNKLLAKGMKRSEIEGAFCLMKERGVRIFAYAFLKAPGLSEPQALQDARDTLSYLTDIGADEIALSCAFVPPGTPLEGEYRAGDFRPPWLWTILQLIEDSQVNGWPISVGGFDDNPPPVAIAHNCGTCDAAVMDLIDRFRTTGTMDADPISCGCKADWHRLLG